MVIGSVSSLHSELMQWNKYARILYESGVEKLHKLAGKDKVAQWCKENNLEEELTKSEAVALPPAPKEPQTKPQTVPSKNKPESSGTFNKKKPFKKVKTSSSGNNDEIDDIFGAF